jgi:iron complex transport system permease protein
MRPAGTAVGHAADLESPREARQPPPTTSPRPPQATPRRSLRRLALTLGMLAALCLALVLACSLGPVSLPPRTVLAAVLGPAAEWLGLPAADPAQAAVVTGIRLPRALLAAITGAALAGAGAVMQAVFRNPLAEPGITGVSSGAAASAVLLIVTGAAAAAPWLLPLGAFLGAIAVVALVQAVAGIARPGSASTLLLVGVALNALLGAVISAAIANAPHDADVQQAIFWLNGDLTASTWGDVGIAAAPAVLGTAALTCFARELNLMLLSEDSAAATGVPTLAVRQGVLAIAALVTASTVAVTGVISFVGLVVPHLVRLVLGPDHRRLLPVSILGGAAFLTLADLAARMLLSPVVLQTGVITALIGAPVLLVLVVRRRAR